MINRALKPLLMLAALTLMLGASGARAEVNEAARLRVDEVMAGMTAEQKVCQLFFVRPEDFARIERVIDGSARLKSAFKRFPVGGVILFPENIKSGARLTALTGDMQRYATEQSGIGVLIAVDEEGGGVARVANKLGLDEKTPALADIGATGDAKKAYEAGVAIGEYLARYGFNLDFAPVADVRADVDNAEITSRSFGYDAGLVSDMTADFVSGLQKQGVMATLKHFPGHGAASGNTHTGGAVSARTLDIWRGCDWLPFVSGIEAGARVVLMSHQTAAAVDGDNPASLSYRIVTELLRGELQFDGVVITDALRMKAIADRYGSGKACVMALKAGCDMLLIPKNFSNGYKGVIEALKSGEVTPERIDESVRRILMLKYDMGLLGE